MRPKQKPPAPESLFSEFPPHTMEEWRAQAASELSTGSDPDVLRWTPMVGITLDPLYVREQLTELSMPGILPGGTPIHRGGVPVGDGRGKWIILQHQDLADPEHAHAATMQGITYGLSGIGFSSRRRGVSYPITRETMATLLDDLPVEALPIDFDAGSRTPAFLALVVRYCRDNGIQTGALSGSIAFDPLTDAEETGSPTLAWPAAVRVLSESLEYAAGNCARVRTIAVDARGFHAAGADAVQELAFGLAKGVEYLRALIAEGHVAGSITGSMRFLYSIGRSFFPEIAKLRASRILWEKAARCFGLPACRAIVHAETTRWDLSLCDPHVNILRGTLGTMAAVLGGADSIGTVPFDVLSDPGERGKRLARNTQLILEHEAHLASVLDPAGGSYYIEIATDRIARAAWTLFQEVERRGGYRAALRDGFVQTRIGGEAERKRERVARRELAFIGASRHPLTGETLRPETGGDERSGASGAARKHTETPPAVRRITEAMQARRGTLYAALESALKAGVTVEDAADAIGASHTQPEPRIQPLTFFRGAEPFEQLRARTASLPEQPLVLLLAFGPRNARRARTAFSRELFLVAGCRTRTRESDDIAELLSAVREQRPAIVVACSSDAAYAGTVPELCAGVRKEHPDIPLLVAGKPRDATDALRAAGVTDFVHVKSDAIALLNSLLGGLEAKGVAGRGGAR